MEQARCCFWNVNERADPALVVELAAEKRCDAIALAEFPGDAREMAKRLSERRETEFIAPDSEVNRIAFVCRAELLGHEVSSDVSDKLTVRRLALGSDELDLAIVHLVSKLDASPEKQASQSRQIVEALRVHERDSKRPTVAVGDFNMNPFEPGMVGAESWHAVMDRELAERQTRTVNRRTYGMFYSPSWGLFGDTTPGPSGTYFRDFGGDPDALGWHVLDQLLVRPAAFPWFPVGRRVEIMDRIADRPLLRNGRPDPDAASDHLPICFVLGRD